MTDHTSTLKYSRENLEMDAGKGAAQNVKVNVAAGPLKIRTHWARTSRPMSAMIPWRARSQPIMDHSLSPPQLCGNETFTR